jgi:hypothetical protein
MRAFGVICAQIIAAALMLILFHLLFGEIQFASLMAGAFSAVAIDLVGAVAKENEE